MAGVGVHQDKTERRTCGFVDHPRQERTICRAMENRQSRLFRTHRDEIQKAITIEIAERNIFWPRAYGICRAIQGERAVAQSDPHLDQSNHRVHPAQECDIQRTVPVHISECQR